MDTLFSSAVLLRIVRSQYKILYLSNVRCGVGRVHQYHHHHWCWSPVGQMWRHGDPLPRLPPIGPAPH